MAEIESRERILQATRARLKTDGILGLRVADIANDAEISITLIYKYYENRDGLLAQVLGDMYDELRQGYQHRVEAWLASTDQLTIEDLIQFAPHPPDASPETSNARKFRLQVLAASLENPQLHERLKATTTASYRWLRDTLEAHRSRLPEADRGFDTRFITLILFNVIFAYYDLVDEDKLSTDEYRAMLVNQVRNSARNTVNS